MNSEAQEKMIKEIARTYRPVAKSDPISVCNVVLLCKNFGYPFRLYIKILALYRIHWVYQVNV